MIFSFRCLAFFTLLVGMLAAPGRDRDYDRDRDRDRDRSSRDRDRERDRRSRRSDRSPRDFDRDGYLDENGDRWDSRDAYEEMNRMNDMGGRGRRGGRDRDRDGDIDPDKFDEEIRARIDAIHNEMDSVHRDRWGDRPDFDRIRRDRDSRSGPVYKEQVNKLYELQVEASRLREEGNTEEAAKVEEQIKEHIHNLHKDANSPDGVEDTDIDSLADSRRRDFMKERERMFEDRRFDRESWMDRERDRRGAPDFRESARKGHSDVISRHKELVSHRIDKLYKRIENAGFTPEEVEQLKNEVNENAAMEYKVIDSRSVDSHRDENGRYKSASERLKNKDGMQERRQQERDWMEQAREGRKRLEERIAEREHQTRARGDL